MEENTHTNESTEALPSSQVRLALEREFGARHFRNTETLGQFLKALRRGNVRENDLLPQPCLTCANGPGLSDCPTPEECMEPGTLWEPRPENLGPFPEQAEHRSLLERNLYLQRQRTAYQQDFVFVARRARLMRDTLQELLEACRNAPAKSLRMVEAMDHAGKALADVVRLTRAMADPKRVDQASNELVRTALVPSEAYRREYGRGQPARWSRGGLEAERSRAGRFWRGRGKGRSLMRRLLGR